LDRVEILTAASRHITIYSERLDQGLVVYKGVVLSKTGTVSIVSFSQILLPLILLYFKNRLFLMIWMLEPLIKSEKEQLWTHYLLIVKVFKWTTVSWFFSLSGFSRKNFSVVWNGCLHYFVDYFILILIEWIVIRQIPNPNPFPSLWIVIWQIPILFPLHY